MQDFRKLRVWIAAQDLAEAVYLLTASFPRAERFGLTAQIRSAVVSIGSNIAEGCGRPGPRELSRFLGIAIGSACELESQLLLAERLGFVEGERDELRAVDSVKRQLIRLQERVDQQP